MNKIKKYWPLVLILIIAFILRFYRLSEFPALNADEAALGYNAWSLIRTGMDEHGNSWPIHLQSFNDFKPALYAYLIMPFIAIGGMNTLMVRFVGAGLGLFNIAVIYLLANEVVDDSKKKSLSSLFPLTSALFLAISPWHIHFSRGGWEVNVATFLVTTGVWLFLRAIKSKRMLHYSISASLFILSLYTYHAARVIVPLLGVGMIMFFWNDLLKVWKSLAVIGFVSLILLLPLARDLAGPSGLSRAAGVGIFSDPGPFNEINEQRGEHDDLASIEAKGLHNKPINYSLAIIENWGEHYAGEFLFLSGDDIQRNKVPEHGQMYLIDTLFVIFGLISIAKVFDKKWGFVLWWLLIGPIAAALTFQSPHALRAQNMVIPLVLISAYGCASIVVWLNEAFKRRYLLTASYVILATVLVWSFARYQQLYWVHMPNAYPFSSQYGVEELINYVGEVKDDYDHIIITDRYDQPYILTLFYMQYPPEDFQGNHELSGADGYGFSTVRDFEKFTFVSLGEWSDIVSNNPNTLIAGTPEEVPDAANIIKTIKFPSGEPAFEIVAN